MGSGLGDLSKLTVQQLKDLEASLRQSIASSNPPKEDDPKWRRRPEWEWMKAVDEWNEEYSEMGRQIQAVRAELSRRTRSRVRVIVGILLVLVLVAVIAVTLA